MNLNVHSSTALGWLMLSRGLHNRIAAFAFIRQSIWPHVHVVIDLHAGGDVARFVPLTSFHPVADPEQSRAIEETARWFGTPLVIAYQNETPACYPAKRRGWARSR